ncbi:MAG: sugar transferase [Proteobacteria bacterium]|nr:sugar transferase [Pseudomonadota bacterium]
MRRQIEVFTHLSTIPVERFGDNLAFAGCVPSNAGASVAAPIEAASERSFEFGETELSTIRSRGYWKVKRVLDFVFSLGLILCVWPIAILVALAVASEVGLPVLFWQSRPGLCGQPFRLYKFRTMSAARDQSGRVLSDDERLGPIGAFLRKTRLDELPQLWNILIGQMSFIGPRPLLPVDQAPGYSARLLVRPGLTGWGQIKGGRSIPAADKAALDIWYVKNASLALDFEIVKGTVPMILRGERIHREAIDQAWHELRQGRG